MSYKDLGISLNLVTVTNSGLPKKSSVIFFSKFSIRDYFSRCDKASFLWLPKKSLMENFIFVQCCYLYRYTKNEVFYYGFLQQIWPNPQFLANFVTFNDKILNAKLDFLCSVHFSVTHGTIRLNTFYLFMRLNRYRRLYSTVFWIIFVFVGS